MHNSGQEIRQEVENRRTFAIISHPDAGKTTLTEKLLLFGGAIRLAGAVKGKKNQKHATSDWMEIEKQRGISVTSSVMQFSYQGYKINILDTPGHQDFSEDTYRTLTAADSAVMLIDAAKGVEAQTIKLFKVCRMKGIPIFTFINKLDRHGKEPLELLEELEQVLDIRSCPMNWPIGMGQNFQGIFDRMNNRLELFQGKENEAFIDTSERGVQDQSLKAVLDDYSYRKLCDDIDLLDIAGDPFDEEKIQKGKLTPVFFGSAISNFGVQSFLDQFIKLAPAPKAHNSTIGKIDVVETAFSGFIFKIQANMNPAHRDRIAFMRICSGKFERGMSVNHVRTGKQIRLAQTQQFLAQDRNTVEEAYPGDIIGLFDPGIFRIGDTVNLAGSFEFEKIPQFAPENFAKVINKNPSKYKQFQKGLNQLIEEGTIQLYKTFLHRTEETILGVVGELQFQVFEYRMRGEYGVEVILDRMPHEIVKWLHPDLKADLERLNKSDSLIVKDQHDHTAIIFDRDFSLRWFKEKNPEIELYNNPGEL
ncbi:MAG: peptide chain release factor 3 [Peptococcaceae bacterium]